MDVPGAYVFKPHPAKHAARKVQHPDLRVLQRVLLKDLSADQMCIRDSLNPGSVSIPKNGSAHSYAVLEGGVMTWKDLEGGEFLRETLW